MEQYQDIDMKLEAMNINNDHDHPLSLSDYLDLQMKDPNSSTNIEWVHSMDDNVDDDGDGDGDGDDDGDDDYDHPLLLPDYVPQQMKEVAMGGMKEEPLRVSTMKANIMKSSLEHDKKQSYLDHLFFLDPDYWWVITAGYKDFPLLKFPYCPVAPFRGLIKEIQKYKIYPSLKNFELELRRVHFPPPPQRIELKFSIIDI